MVFSKGKKDSNMTITKTKNGTYRLRVYIPEEAKNHSVLIKN